MNRTVFLSSLFFIAFLSLFANSSCNKEPGATPTPASPSISIADISAERQSAQSSVFFFVTLSSQSATDVAVSYRLREGTAKFNTDFIDKQGTVTVPAGALSVSFEVIVAGGDLRKENVNFFVELHNPVGCTLADSVAVATIIDENGLRLPTANTGYTTPNSYPGYTLAWSDEFDGAALNTASWNYEIGNGSNGWGNNERQYYTSRTKNVFLSEGNLIIEARKDNIENFLYSSARLTTKGKREFQFGRIDMRAKLPKGQGIWPALWMLGANINSVGWPSCGEIDIMELVGHEPNRVHGTLHWRGVDGHLYRGSSTALSSGDFSDEFHVFSLIWQEDSLVWYVDDREFYRMTRADFGAAAYPFNAPQFFIFNVAVGGNWPGDPNPSTTFPQRMFVDYVRIFQ